MADAGAYIPPTDPDDVPDPVIWYNAGNKTWIASNSLSISGSLKYNDWIYIATKHWWITRDVANVKRFEKYVREQDAERYANALQAQRDNFEVSHAEFNDKMPWAVDPTPADGSVPNVKRFAPRARGSADEAFPFQTVVITEILKRNLLIADEMGLGKTVQAIEAMNALWTAYYSKKPFRVLIVSPNTMVLKWHVEIAKWITIPITEFSYNVIPWSQLVSYVKDNPDKQHELVIVDEAHYAKNSGSKRSQAFSKLKATHRIALTGTPILGRPSEIFPIADWVEPMVLGTPTQFDAKYEVKNLARAAGGRMYWKYSVDLQKVEGLQRKLRETIMLARFKKDVLPQLPPKQRSVVEIDFGTEVTDLEARMLALWDELEAKGGKDMAIRTNIFALRHEAAKLKVPMVNAFVEETWLDSQRPLVVFCHHKLVLEEIAAHMKQIVGDRVASISGKQSASARSLIVEQFQDGQYDVLVAGLTVGGLGITLTAGDVAIFAELDWTPANLIQAEDRLHRIGQENPVNIYYAVSAGQSIDGKLARILGDKQEVIDAFTRRLKPLQS